MFVSQSNMCPRTSSFDYKIKRSNEKNTGVMKAAPAGLETMCLDGFCNPIGERTSC